MTDHVTTAACDAWVRRFAELISQERDHLTELDSAIGDADHGTNMDRGMKAVVVAVDAGGFESADQLFKKVGMTLVSTVGGESGPLYGTFFLRFGTALQGVDDIDAKALGSALRAGVEGILARGKAELDDKTMYDAWSPALDAYDETVDAGVARALDAAAAAAAEGRDRVTPLVARKG